MDSRGFTLVELIVVMVIIGIVIAVATLDFQSMQEKGQVEKQTRIIHSELSALRIDAMQKKQKSAAFLGPKQIIFKRYTSDAEAVLTGGTTISTISLQKEIRNLAAMSTQLNVTTDRILIDTRGYSSNFTLVVLPVNFNSVDNCILVSTARTNIGRMDDASTCTAH